MFIELSFSSRVYFADSKLDYIEFVDYDGKGRVQVLASTKLIQHPHAMSIFEDHIYYSDRRLQRLQLYPKYPNGTSREYPSHSFSKALGVIAIHPVLQPQIKENPCSTSGCSHICALGANGTFTCLCPSGHVIEEGGGGRQCVLDKRPFMLLVHKSMVVGAALNNEGESSNKKHLPHEIGGIVPISGLRNTDVIIISDLKSNIFFIRMLNTTL
ncbi:unnamed protein product [Meloidogyne enterolobii]|uniref:Uncharacterized protein n=1 Tax=Meloidogyne enterolobii TaxID=390850 RepID=A0ACB1AXP3_MELEN